MKRKDCDRFHSPAATKPHRGPSGYPCVLIGAVAVCASLWECPVRAGSIHIWSTAVVVEDSIRLADVAELRGFEAVTERKLAQLVVAPSPAPGGSRIIVLQQIREALQQASVNFAEFTLHGLTQCAVSRSGFMEAPRPSQSQAHGGSSLPAGSKGFEPRSGSGESTGPAERTLREVILDSLNAEFARFGGHAEVTWDRTSEQVLNLSAPTFDFTVHRRSPEPIGLVSLEIEVSAREKPVQTIPLVARVAMVKPTVVARRAVNQSASIRAADLEVIPMTFHRLESTGFDDPGKAIGQRARRLIPEGTVVEADMLETSPLVFRGQLVRLISGVGSVKVTASGKAMQNGMLGEGIKVRTSEPRDVELDAVVIAPGVVEVQAGSGIEGPRVAEGGKRR